MKAKTTALDHVPKISLETLPGWDALIAEDQRAIRNEDRLLTEDLYELGKRRLSLGKRLLNIQIIMRQKRIWTSYVKARGWSTATAYRAINLYQEANTILPSPIMQVALMRGVDKINARLVKAFPPPKSNNPAVLGKYIDKVSQKEKGSEPDEADTGKLAEMYKREVINFIRSRAARLPSTMSKREKNQWWNEIRGMTLTLQGISNPLTIEAEAIPEGYVRPRGRPRLPLKMVAS